MTIVEEILDGIDAESLEIPQSHLVELDRRLAAGQADRDATPSRKVKLDELLSRITPENRHGEYWSGEAVGGRAVMSSLVNHSPVRGELLEKLALLVELSPDVRFGQLLANLAFLAEDQTDRSLWDIEDEPLLEVVERHRAELSRRRESD